MSIDEDYENLTNEELKERIAEITATLEKFTKECNHVLDELPHQLQKELFNQPSIKELIIMSQTLSTELSKLECELFERNQKETK